jgi:hypothetical protein
MLAIVVFLAAAIGLTVLADQTIKDAQRKSAAAQMGDIYRAITGDPYQETFGYLGDVGDYPATLNALIQSPGLTGWNGPYVNTALVSVSTIYDLYGSPLEYFLKLSNGSTDQLAIVSKGPDHSSSNTAPDPNDRTLFTAPWPSDVTYLSTAGNADNQAYPALSAVSGTFDYQNVGTLEYDVLNKDAGQAGSPITDACPLLYSLVVASRTRPTDTITIPYNAKGAYDFLQGVYDVRVDSPIFLGDAMVESVAIFPGRKNVRVVRSVDTNSTSTPSLTMTIKNNTNVVLTIKKNGTNMTPATIAAGVSQAYTTPTCGAITAVNGATTYDSWIMPWNINSTHAIANGANVYTFTITNIGGYSKQLIVLQDGITIGTIYVRKTKVFNVPQGATIVVEQQNGGMLATFSSVAGGQTLNY